MSADRACSMTGSDRPFPATYAPQFNTKIRQVHRTGHVKTPGCEGRRRDKGTPYARPRRIASDSLGWCDFTAHNRTRASLFADFRQVP